MSARKVVVDIETIPCAEENRRLLRRPRPVEAPGFWSRLFRQQPAADTGEDPYLQTSLNWTFGRIICIGMLIQEDGRPTETRAFVARIDPSDTLAVSIEKEGAALREFWSAVMPDDYFIGHNILDFDLPFLWNRSLVCGVRASRPLLLERKSVQFTFDTMQVWGHWSGSHGSRQYASLNNLSQVLGLPGKSGAGNQVYDLWRRQRFDEIRDYCLSDVKLEYDVYRRMTLDGSVPALRWNRENQQG
jgi:3'-5' exonuclease